jgi:hypothetical protein
MSSGHPLPKWCVKIVERLAKTILKPILKLKPNGTMNWRNYGKMMGLFERYKTFIAHDMERMWQTEGLDKMTDQEWEELRPLFGMDKLCAQLSAILGRSVAEDDGSLDKAVDELFELQFKHLEKLKSEAFWHVAQQDARTSALFFKGMAEGYTCMMDEEGRFVGDRGRSRIYFDFLVYRIEIEKYRKTMPSESRHDLQKWVIKKNIIRIPNDPEWFDHFCDEMSLCVKGVGRKPRSQIL